MSGSDIEAVVALVVAAKLFSADEAGVVRALLDGYTSAPDDGHSGVVDEVDGCVVGVAYYQPRGPADRLWDLTMIAVEPGSQGGGRGRALLRHVEDELSDRGQRLLVVETSSTDQYDRARDFYRTCGYLEEARIRDYWQDGDDLVVFTKRLDDSRDGSDGTAQWNDSTR